MGCDVIQRASTILFRAQVGVQVVYMGTEELFQWMNHDQLCGSINDGFKYGLQGVCNIE